MDAIIYAVLILVGLSFELKHLFDGGEYPFLLVMSCYRLYILSAELCRFKIAAGGS